MKTMRDGFISQLFTSLVYARNNIINTHLFYEFLSFPVDLTGSVTMHGEVSLKGLMLLQ